MRGNSDDGCQHRLLANPAIEERLDFVAAFLMDDGLNRKIRGLLGQIGDLERLISRISMPFTNVADIVRLRSSLQPLPHLAALFDQDQNQALTRLFDGFDALENLYELLVTHILESPKLKLNEGGYIKSGVDAELDRLKDLMKNGKQLIANMEAAEKTEPWNQLFKNRLQPSLRIFY